MQSSGMLEGTASKKTRHNYYYIRGIGKGSFGEANLVRDGDGQLLAMKKIDFSKLDRTQQKEAINEVRILSSLNNPYIVRYRESFEDNGMLAIVMDYAEGGDLAHRISRQCNKRELFAEGRIIRWFTEIFLGLKYLHFKRILHRDVKPCNVFLTKQDDLCLGDFGLSVVLSNKDGVEDIKDKGYVGTPCYLSPEVFADKLYSFASDIWALGCVLHEMAALRAPFEAENFNSLAKKVIRDPAPILPSRFSEDLRQISRDLLYWDYHKRPSVAELARKPMIRSEVRKILIESADENTPSNARMLPEHCQSASTLTMSDVNRSRSNIEATQSKTHAGKRRASSVAARSSSLGRVGSSALISSMGALENTSPKHFVKDDVFDCDLKSLRDMNNCQKQRAQKRALFVPGCTPVFSRCAARTSRMSRCRNSAVLVLQGVH